MKNVEVTDKNGAVVAITQVHANEELLVMTEQGKILRTPANEIRTIGRATQGVRLMDLEGEDKIVSVALVEAAVAEDAPRTVKRAAGDGTTHAYRRNRMSPSTHSVRSGLRNIAAAVLLVPAILLVISCSRPPEQQFLTQFFRAARGRDNTTVGRMSAVEIDPRTQGTVEDFSIESISEETRTPLTFKPLFEAETKAEAGERRSSRRRSRIKPPTSRRSKKSLKIEAQPDGEAHAGAGENQARMGQVARGHLRSRARDRPAQPRRLSARPAWQKRR